MRVLNVEDDAYKRNDICKALKGTGTTKVDWVRNLEDALSQIKEVKYDLIISDMWYPPVSGGKDEESGEILIEKIKEMEMDIPIIICSSVNYRIPEILGTIHYSKNGDWERDLKDLIKKIR